MPPPALQFDRYEGHEEERFDMKRMMSQGNLTVSTYLFFFISLNKYLPLSSCHRNGREVENDWLS